MLSLHCRKNSGLAVAARVLRVCNYHTYPEPNEVPIIKTARSSTQKQIEKSKGPWKDEFLDIKKKFHLGAVFPGVEESLVHAKSTMAPIPEMTRLENGLSVVSISTADMSMTSFAFLVNAGSADEVQSSDDSLNTGGITALIDSMSFGVTSGGGDAEETVSRKLYRIGAIDQVTSNREQICYFVDVMHASAERGLQLLAEAVLHPNTTPEAVELAVNNLSFRSDYMSADMLSRDAIAMAAYKGSPLGNYSFPTNMPLVALHTPEKIEKFRRSIVFGDNCVLAAAGMSHSDLVSMAKKYFGEDQLPAHPPKPSSLPRAATVYTGGLYLEQRELQEPFVKLALGYEVGGYKSDNLYAMCVLEKLLGGGSSFSAGGPGKGMYTRLYLDVLNQHHWIESAQSFVAPHVDNGILGIDASCKSENIQYLFQVMLNEFLRLASDRVTDVELSRAKNMLKSQLMMQLESRIVVCEDIARQYGTFGKRDPPSETCKQIDSVTADQLKTLVRTMLLQPPSIVCIGEDVSQLPSYEALREFTMNKALETLNNSK